MDPSRLIPSAEAIPAPWWLLEFLTVLTLTLHLLLINVALGGSLILLFSRLKGGFQARQESTSSLLSGKIPTLFALGITLGVAPLLFVQVLYGHFFYTGSVLMAVFWIMVIPLLIIGYYGAYINARKQAEAPGLATAALVVTSLVLLYIAFAFQNNISLGLQPGRWEAYFQNRSGTILSLDDPVLWPRYFHFIIASVAVAGLFSALVWGIRQRRGAQGAEEKVRHGLRIFAVATMIQVVIGLWLLLALPSEIMLQFMGRNLLYTALLVIGILLALAAIMTAVKGRLASTVALLLGTVVVMILTRTVLRHAYLESYFKVETLQVAPQYDVLGLFLVVFIIGLVAVGYMIRWAVTSGSAKEAA